ncbi:sensor histidine kinase [Candidatus Nitrosotenuis sp. DW1]|uniref:sensor histidine kinase n=1 Tax=Candidatus Nitrosotenuis sp. DW1 TaxID=2259672 RepID=UPI0015CEEC74|nr:HAMP domain-containing sensor histidine kinase [Candidatus Nitrosotenuis sp. DW1]
MAKFIRKSTETDLPDKKGRVIYFSKSPSENAETNLESHPRDPGSDHKEFDKLTKSPDDQVSIEDIDKKQDRIVTINNIIKEEEKQIKDIQTLIEQQSKNLDRAKKLLREKQSLLQTEFNRKTSQFSSSDKFSIVGEFSSKMAHDIRNPLSVIKIQVDLLKLRYSKQEDKILLDSLGRMERAVGGITTQLDDVLHFLKDRTLHLESIGILKILEESLFYIEKPENITIDLPTNDIAIMCDKTGMQRVFTNIILNSIQAMNNEGTVSIQASEQNDDVVIEVKDTGPGIPDKYMQKIFEPLFTTKKGGTGLGLSICKKIIDEHHGSIVIKNNPTTFTITIPKTQ